MPTLRLLSVDARAFGADRAALARTIAAAEPDVAAVHGAPQLLRWRSTCAAIARRSGLVVVTGGRTAAANLLMSSLAVDVTAVRDLRIRRAGELRRPGAALAALRRQDAGFVLACATLVGNAVERVAQARRLDQAIDRLVASSLPAIVCAEGADRPGTSTWQALATNRTGVAGRIFVDGRIDIGEVRELPAAAGAGVPPVLVELSVAGD